jgi:hypothetical protein
MVVRATPAPIHVEGEPLEPQPHQVSTQVVARQVENILISVINSHGNLSERLALLEARARLEDMLPWVTERVLTRYRAERTHSSHSPGSAGYFRPRLVERFARWWCAGLYQASGIYCGYMCVRAVLLVGRALSRRFGRA